MVSVHCHFSCQAGKGQEPPLVWRLLLYTYLIILAIHGPDGLLRSVLLICIPWLVLGILAEITAGIIEHVYQTKPDRPDPKKDAEERDRIFRLYDEQERQREKSRSVGGRDQYQKKKEMEKYEDEMSREQDIF